MRDPDEADDDSYKSTELARRIQRERLELCIRRKQVAPDPQDAEQKCWAAEGEK